MQTQNNAHVWMFTIIESRVDECYDMVNVIPRQKKSHDRYAAIGI